MNVVPPDEILDLYGYLPLVQTLRNSPPDSTAPAPTVPAASAPADGAGAPNQRGARVFDDGVMSLLKPAV